MKGKMTQIDLVKEYFINNPNRNIEHPEVVDWVVAEWNKRTGGTFRDRQRNSFIISKGILDQDIKRCVQV